MIRDFETAASLLRRFRRTAKSMCRSNRPVAARCAIVILFGSTWAELAAAECKLPMRESQLSEFVQNPRKILNRYPEGGDGLVFFARIAASFNRSGLHGVEATLRYANPAQKRAIGGGLADAVSECLPRDGEIAKQIADVVKLSADLDLVDAYLAKSDEPAFPRVPPDSDETKRGPARVGYSRDLPISSDSVPKLVEPVNNLDEK